jgi:hypothetical protein
MSEINPRDILRQQAEAAQQRTEEPAWAAESREVEARLGRHFESLTITARYIIDELQRRSIRPDVTLVSWQSKQRLFGSPKITLGAPVARGWKTHEWTSTHTDEPSPGSQAAWAPTSKYSTWQVENGSCLLVQSGMGSYLGRGAIVRSTGVYPDYFTNPTRQGLINSDTVLEDPVGRRFGYVPNSFSIHDKPKVLDAIGMPRQTRYNFSDLQLKKWYFADAWLQELSHFARERGIS